MKRTIDSRQMRMFTILARHLNFTRAAEELKVTQSAVSHAMNALERNLGYRLLHRLNRRVWLTPAGEYFLRAAENILVEMAVTRAKLDALPREIRRRCHLPSARRRPSSRSTRLSGGELASSPA